MNEPSFSVMVAFGWLIIVVVFWLWEAWTGLRLRDKLRRREAELHFCYRVIAQMDAERAALQEQLRNREQAREETGEPDYDDKPTWAKGADWWKGKP